MRCRQPFNLAVVPAAAALALLAAGCGGASPRVANITTSTTATTTQQNAQNGLLAFSRCMRANGIPSFPDPQHFASGSIKLTIHHLGIGTSATLQTAMNTCRHLLPAGYTNNNSGGQQITPADKRDYLKAAACMRRHGFPDIPDPTFQNNSITWNMPPTVNQNSPAAVKAVTTCQKRIPPGLPYSGS